MVEHQYLFFCRQERARYYKNRQLATEKPTEYLSLIVDGMDQNKTNIPSLVSLYDRLSTRFSCIAIGVAEINYICVFF